MSDPELISKILSCYAEIEDFSQEIRPELEDRLKISRDQRRALLQSARAMNLKIKDCNYQHALDDLFDTDDTGKLVDTTFKIKVLTIDEVCRAIDFCRENKLLALPIGAKTSALGVFEARSFADREGLKGIVGIEFEDIFCGPNQNKERACLLQLPEHNAAEYDLIIDSSGVLALLKAQQNTVPHRVFAYAGTHIVDVNNFLNQHLISKQYSFRIMPDPTSWAEAQIGGIIATGAEGGNRAKASEDLKSLLVVDANGCQRFLNQEQAANVVGLNGNAGIIYQAEFEVTAFPKYEHGIFVALKGRDLNAWIGLLEFQHLLKPFARSASGEARVQVGADSSGIIVTSIEPLSTKALELACGENRDEFERKLKRLAAAGDFVVFVTFNSFLSAEASELYASEFFTKLLGLNLEAAEFDDDENFIVQHPIIAGMRLLSEQELKRMDQVRHEAPSHARELAKRLGGVTASSDLNIRFESENESENKTAFEQVAKLYYEYAKSFTKDAGFTVVVYGHLHPGVGSGGGIDPHVRVIFELSNPGSRYNAPEQVQLLKKKQAQLYRQLLALDGQYGIQILSPEKSRFTNTEYWSWLCLKYPAEATKYLQTIVDLGYGEVAGETLPIIGARIPHTLPKIFPVSGSVKALLNPDYLTEINSSELPAQNALNINPQLAPYLKAVLELCQSSHRGGKIRRILRFVLEKVAERLKLAENQYVFFVEDVAEVQEIVDRNFPNGSFNVSEIVLSDLSASCQNSCLQPEDIYAIDLDKLGVPSGLALMVVPQQAIWQSYQDQLNGKSSAAFRSLYELWSSAPFETMETPNLPAIACLGLLLEQDLWSSISANGKKGEALCLVPGPAQLDAVLFDRVAELWQIDYFSQNDQQKIIAQLKDYIGMPDNHELAFYASATQCMQVLATALKNAAQDINLIQVVNDAFGERLANILSKTGRAHTKITTPWTTSENSQLQDVSHKIASAIRLQAESCKIVFITPHKTATTADVLPDHLVSALAKLGLLLGRDYHLIVDITSGVGARNYATLLCPDTGKRRLPFSGFFCGVQKALALPAGLAFVGLSPALVKILTPSKVENSRLSLLESCRRAREGQVIQDFHLYLLGLKLKKEIANSSTIDQIELECRARMDLLLGWIERHPDLMALVPNSNDRSPLILGIFSQAKNLQIAKRLMAEIFNIYLGSGYGPFEREAIRIYLANINYEQLKFVLAALDLVLELDDVVHTRGEKVPNIALREPHDPLAVIARVAENFTVDGLIKDQLGLEWLGRLVKTYNANVIAASQKMRLGGKIPWSSVGHQEKARIYGEQKNLTEMCKILGLRNEDTKLDILYHFQLFKETEIHLRNRVLSNPHAVWSDDSFSATIQDLLVRAERHLDQIKHLLNKYVNGNGDSVSPLDGSSASVEATRDSQGRVEWPIVA